MIIVGVDPGLQITGYGVLKSNGQKAKVLEAGIIKTVRTDSLETKLKEIDVEIRKIIEQYQPNYVAIEELYSHYAHPKTAIIMAHARGITFLQAAKSNVPVISYSATRIKKSLTGNGRASKSQMQRMIKIALELKHDIESPDTADALAVALCHHNALMGR
ncbi:MAG: crossover junction endodeoxyribonuclease RuvC [Candidatus Zixiibacteriota bacterium]